MTDAGWADKAVSKATTCPDGVSVVYAPTVEKLLKAEHARAIRIVKAEMRRVKLSQYQYGAHEKAYMLTSLDNVLAALQRGRGGKG